MSCDTKAVTLLDSGTDERAAFPGSRKRASQSPSKPNSSSETATPASGGLCPHVTVFCRQLKSCTQSGQKYRRHCVKRGLTRVSGLAIADVRSHLAWQFAQTTRSISRSESNTSWAC